MTDRQKAVMLTMAVAAFESVRADEAPKTARYRRLTAGIDWLVELTGIYLLDHMPAADVTRAGDLIDEFNDRIKEVFT